MEDILGLILFIFIDLVFVWTGEIVKFVFTIGRYKPAFKKTLGFYNFSSLFLGIAFWVIFGITISVIL